MPNPALIQNKIDVLKIYLETTPEKLTEIRDLCIELIAEIDKYLQNQSGTRKFPRLDLILPVRYAFYRENGRIGDIERSGVIRDISLGGAMIEINEKPNPETPIILSLQLLQKPVHIKGYVKRVKDFRTDTWLVGIEFTEIEEKDLRTIFRFLADNYG